MGHLNDSRYIEIEFQLQVYTSHQEAFNVYEGEAEACCVVRFGTARLGYLLVSRFSAVERDASSAGRVREDRAIRLASKRMVLRSLPSCGGLIVIV